MERSETYRAFWPRYLGEHRNAATRGLHFLGTALGLVLLAGGVASGIWWLFPLALICGYAFAWLAHIAVERNRPATFTHPLWSFVSDFRMFFVWLGGGMPDELRRNLPGDA
ncbi:DUF962 domain-containing protein [Pelagibius litoralis]|uniref:DUF962 domain-containing protein n=1 Tax=Pelagibius litoralis TaxID=374515 RepID=A0A967CBJ0_9PROT|nr:DUF962 domain-containing protein [Pelagibius litoralis]NIA68234.1 DUF962 domain-containing protein [Pelagibius litoralis]